MSFKTFPVEVVARRMVTPSVLELSLRRADGEALAYQPGQFVNIHFRPQDDPEGELIHRSYSVASAPADDGVFPIAIAPIEGGRATTHLFGLEPGDTTLASGPYGRFVLKDDPPTRHLLVGTGTGITPYRAMLPGLAARLADPAFSVELLLGVRDAAEALYADDFQAFADAHERVRFRRCLSRVAAEDCGEGAVTGYVQQQFAALDLDPERDQVYLCGNPDMIDQAFELLKDMGFPMPSVRREKYLPARS